MSKRLFAAIKINLSEPSKNFLGKIKNDLSGENAKWVEADNIHLTLRFFGDADNFLEGKIISVLDNISHRCHSFKIHLCGLGCFLRSDSTQILWVGLDESKELSEMVKILNEELLARGFTEAEHKFRPHLTIARLNSIVDNDNLENILSAYRHRPIETIEVEKIILFQSILRPSGPLYLEEKSFPLPKNSF